MEKYFITTLGTNRYWLGIRQAVNYKASTGGRGQWEDLRGYPDPVPSSLAELQVGAHWQAMSGTSDPVGMA